jgi:hypothetical protein
METRVYGINLDMTSDEVNRKIVDFELSDSEFVEISKSCGGDWSLKEFEHYYNIDDIYRQVIIRFIQTEK